MPNHFVFVGTQETSHLRLLLQLSLNLLHLHPSLVTTFVIADIAERKFNIEYELQPHSLMERVGSRFTHRVLNTGGGDDATINPEQFSKYSTALTPVIEEMMEGKGQGRWAIVPCAFFVDVFLCDLVKGPVSEITPKLGLPKVPVFHVNGSAAVAHSRLFADDENGGPFDKIRERYEERIAEGMADLDAANAASWNIRDRLLTFPDLPPMYDYEFSPQAANIWPAAILPIAEAILHSARNMDGFVCSTILELEEKSIPYLEKTMGMPVIGVGPQFNETVWIKADHQRVGEATENDERLLGFLDESLKKYGSNCAAFITFGSYSWPKHRMELITHLLESLLEVEPIVPFIFATPAPVSREGDTKIPDELIKKVEESGRGIITGWAPQVRILQHEATGMMLTHCGMGSMMEAIVSGVPLIGLPFGTDQPEGDAFYIGTKQCGLQLSQMNTGHNGRTFANGVRIQSTPEAIRKELQETWKKMRGAEGERYRKNVAEVAGIIRTSSESGGARANMLRLGEYFTDKEQLPAA